MKTKDSSIVNRRNFMKTIGILPVVSGAAIMAICQGCSDTSTLPTFWTITWTALRISTPRRKGRLRFFFGFQPCMPTAGSSTPSGHHRTES